MTFVLKVGRFPFLAKYYTAKRVGAQVCTAVNKKQYVTSREHAKQFMQRVPTK